MKEKVIDVAQGKESFSGGEKVVVIMENRCGSMTLFVGYLIPFLIVVLSLITGITVFHKEGIATGFSLGVLVIYYIVLYFNRHHLQRIFTYKIEKVSKN